MEQNNIDTLKKIAYFAIGVLTPEDGKFTEMVDSWIDKGKMTEEEGRKFINEMYEKAESVKKDLENSVSEYSKNFIEKLNIASLDKINELEARIKALEKKN